MTSAEPDPLSSIIPGVPFLPQEDETCGPSSSRWSSGSWQGCHHAGNRPGDPHGGSEGDAHHRPGRRRKASWVRAEVVDLDLPRLRERISAGVPVILLVDLGIWNWSRPHYLVAYGWTRKGWSRIPDASRGK